MDSEAAEVVSLPIAAPVEHEFTWWVRKRMAEEQAAVEATGGSVGLAAEAS